MEQADELSMAPTSPADTPAEDPEFPGQARHAALPAPAAPALPQPVQVPPHEPQPPTVITVDEPEPNQEPATMATAPTTPDAPMTTSIPGTSSITSTSLNLYEPAAADDFRQRRLRMDQHETMQFAPFGPMRRQAQRQAPYESQAPSSEPHPSTSDPAAELFGQAFTVSDIGGDDLPKCWSVDEQGYFQLDMSKYHDYWEVRAGCLIKHHLRPRHRRHDITKDKDCPFELKQLDPVRVTMMRMPSGIVQVVTDRFDSTVPMDKSAWTGITAKVKELQSFFEHGVWEFSNVKEADPKRTLTSRMLLKWSKNADGSPRAKARLVVRGYTDEDALNGKLDAPRRWFLEASRRLTSLKLRPHILDPCAFIICETDFPEIEATDPSKCFGSERIVGMICIHVDDMLGGGLAESKVYQHVIAQLRQTFNFREWKDQDKLEYCGATLTKTDTGGWKLDHAEYLHKVKR
eukprot:s2820_g2.t1